jgi:hypothetical protein
MKKLPILFLVILLTRCAPDAPHSNPYDPENPDSRGTIKGTVVTLFGADPISGAIVEFFPTGKKDTTNIRGEFNLSNLIPQEYIVSVIHLQYVEESDTVELEGGEEKDMTFDLNGRPTIVDCSIHSLHLINHISSPFERYEGIYELVFFDPDHYIADSVIAQSEFEKLSLPYYSGESLGFYKLRIPYSVLNTIDTLIGVPINFWTKDLGGSFSDTVTSSLSRVVSDSITIFSPIDGDTIQTGDTILWATPSVSFTPSVFITIWERGSNVENPFWMSDTLSDTTSSYIFSDSLKSGEYELGIEVKDRIGNTSRTVELFHFIE